MPTLKIVHLPAVNPFATTKKSERGIMGLLGKKFASLGNGLKDSLAEAKTKTVSLTASINVPVALTDLSESVSSKARDYAATGMEQVGKLADQVGEKLSEIDYESLKRRDTYVVKFQEYAKMGGEKAAAYFNSTFEVDKTTEEMITDVRRRMPVPPAHIDDIFAQCKREACRRTIAFFFPAGISELDETLSARYSNLSVNFGTFKDSNHSMKRDQNFADLRRERINARREGTLLENGYNSGAPLDPRVLSSVDIEHIVPKAEIYNDWLFRIGTNDAEVIKLVNVEENLIFANDRLNGSKGDTDLLKYMKQNGKPDAADPDLLHFIINGKDVTVRESEATEKYEKARERLSNEKLEVATKIGFTLASSSARMAAQQVVGLILLETIDIFVDEIKDIAINGKLFDENGLLANINARREYIAAELKTRFEERDIWARARAAGIEGGVAGALSAIPQILISLLVQMPAFVLSIIRECTLSTVRCVRVLMSDDTEKFDSIKVIMAGAAAGVLSAYVANIISKGVAVVPGLNTFNSQVTSILTGLVVTAVPLSAIYVFEKNKAKFVFQTFAS